MKEVKYDWAAEVETAEGPASAATTPAGPPAVLVKAVKGKRKKSKKKFGPPTHRPQDWCGVCPVALLHNFGLCRTCNSYFYPSFGY